MKVYSLTQDIIENSLRNPSEVVDGYEGTKIAHHPLNGKVLRIVFIETQNTMKVITAYPALKKRYIK